MDAGMKKKLIAMGAAALGAFLFGESQVLDMEERLTALEDIHPELKQEELDEIVEDLQSEDAVSQEPEVEGVSEEE
jgi:hypothetical protein|tara:strand:+ start:237 stop:464 length:228 start_codon:yes stop_codon:yes gene_type:complete